MGGAGGGATGGVLGGVTGITLRSAAGAERESRQNGGGPGGGWGRRGAWEGFAEEPLLDLRSRPASMMAARLRRLRSQAGVVKFGRG